MAISDCAPETGNVRMAASAAHSVPAERRGAASPRRAPWTRDVDLVFLVGCPRSGTTWLQSLIASHPAIHTGPETQFFGAYHPLEREYLREKDGRCGISEYLQPDGFYQLVAESFWTVVSAVPAPAAQPVYFLEKSAYHCVFAEFILRTFPRARFIHLIRDARAVVASLLRASRTWGAGWAPKTALQATQFWYQCVQAGCGISDLVSSPSQYIGIRYEDVRSAPEEYLGGIFDWLGLPYDPELGDRAVKAHSLAARELPSDPFPSVPLVNQASPLPKWPADFVGPAPCAAELTDLSAEDRATVERAAVDVLRELGYAVRDH